MPFLEFKLDNSRLVDITVLLYAPSSIESVLVYRIHQRYSRNATTQLANSWITKETNPVGPIGASGQPSSTHTWCCRLQHHLAAAQRESNMQSAEQQGVLSTVAEMTAGAARGAAPAAVVCVASGRTPACGCGAHGRRQPAATALCAEFGGGGAS
jgi:hypothetical protein